MQMGITNKLLGVVIAFALTSGIAAHAAQAPQRPLAPIDPGAAIRSAYARDHVALEHLRQQASQLKGSAHPAFNQYVSDQESALTELERTALATSRPVVASTIAALDALVSQAQAKLDLELSQAGATKAQGSSKSGTSHQGKN
jgi:hypothetical protein